MATDLLVGLEDSGGEECPQIEAMTENETAAAAGDGTPPVHAEENEALAEDQDGDKIASAGNRFAELPRTSSFSVANECRDVRAYGESQVVAVAASAGGVLATFETLPSTLRVATAASAEFQLTVAMPCASELRRRGRTLMCGFVWEVRVPYPTFQTDTRGLGPPGLWIEHRDPFEFLDSSALAVQFMPRFNSNAGSVKRTSEPEDFGRERRPSSQSPDAASICIYCCGHCPP